MDFPEFPLRCLVNEIEGNWKLKSMLDEEDLGFVFLFCFKKIFEEENVFKYETVLSFLFNLFLLSCL